MGQTLAFPEFNVRRVSVRTRMALAAVFLSPISVQRAASASTWEKFMSPEERQVLVELFQRTNAAAGQPRDKDAEAFIAEAVRLQPYAPYLLAQAVLLQEQAMKSASERLQQLETENQQLREEIAQGGPAPQQQGQGAGEDGQGRPDPAQAELRQAAVAPGGVVELFPAAAPAPL